MRRREFFGVLSGAAASPLVARAQAPGRTYRIAMQVNVARQSSAMNAFIDEMQQAGFVEGRNLEIIPGGFNLPTSDRRCSGKNGQGRPRRHRQRRQCRYQGGAAGDTNHSDRRHERGSTGRGLGGFSIATSGNTTGLSILSPGLDGKRQDLLIEIVPHARRIAALFETRNTPAHHTQALQLAAQTRGVELAVYGASVVDDIAPAIDAAKAAGAEAINFLATPLYPNNKTIVFARLQTLRLPAIYQWPDLAEDGGLAGYGPRFTEMFRQRARKLNQGVARHEALGSSGGATDRIRACGQPQSRQSYGHEIPAELVLRADKLID